MNLGDVSLTLTGMLNGTGITVTSRGANIHKPSTSAYLWNVALAAGEVLHLWGYGDDGTYPITGDGVAAVEGSNASPNGQCAAIGMGVAA